MENGYTLRNMITLLCALFVFVACDKDNYNNSSTIEDVRTISSEDKVTSGMSIEEVKNETTGQTIIYVQKR